MDIDRTQAWAVQKFGASGRPAGEPFVWFTGMGLVAGLAMITFLLALIVWKGFEVFWPVRVAQIELRPDGVSNVGGKHIAAGEIRKRQEKPLRVVEPERQARRAQTEWQLFLGNKDIYGFNFKFFNLNDIENVTYPEDIIKIERWEYGDAIGYPDALKLAEGQVISYGHERFIPVLEALKDKSVHRWHQIRKIEKNDIGKINYQMERLRLKKKALVRKGEASSAERMISIEDKMRALEADYRALADKASALRQEQRQDSLRYRLATGAETEIELGQVVDFYFPNRLNFWGRFIRFLNQMRIFVTHDPREANTEGGIFPAIFGTFVMTVLMSIAVTPFGVLAAVYLREYARQGLLVRIVRIAVNNLAGVPSIVFGVFGLGFFVYLIGGTIDSVFFREALPTPTFGTGGIFWASLTLALLTVPVVIVSTEEALSAAPRGMREGSMACGASKWQTIERVVLPAAAPGILTGLILAMARGAGEVAPLMITGVVKLAPSLPVDGMFPFVHLDRKFMHLGFHIYDLGFQSPDSEAAKPMVFATTLLLIGLVIVLNMGAVMIRERLRRKYAGGTF